MPRVNLGNRSLSYTLSGEAEPAVIFENGLGAAQEDWAAVVPRAAEFFQVLTYDRAGLGASDPAPRPRTCQDMVDDLAGLLAHLHLEPPYVLAAHSFGGLVARLFAAQHTGLVTGMLLVDCPHEDRDAHFERVLSEELIQRNRRYLADPARNSEGVDRPASNAQVRVAGFTLACPVFVLARGLPDEPDPIWPSAALQQVEFDLQRQLAAAYRYGSFMVAEKSGHYIQKDQPDLVIRYLRALVDGARLANMPCI